MSDESSWTGNEEPEGGDANEETTASVDGFGTPTSEEETVAGAMPSAFSGAGDSGDDAAGMESEHTKLCVFCISEIDALATRCNRCGGYLPPAEGTDFKQHWTLLFTCVSVFVACIWLPIEGLRNDVYASQSIAGGFLTVFAGYGIFACWANLFHRKMIVWPALFMAFDGLYVTIRRLVQLFEKIPEGGAPAHQYPRLLGGPGLYVILLCSLLVFWTLMRGAAAGAKKDKERKEAARAARKR